jgi:putative ABC transport system permease protein
MTRHLLKLVWNRKRTQALVMLEILCSFLVVFALVAAGLTLAERLRLPLGYDWRDVWAVHVDRLVEGGRWDPADVETLARLQREARALPGVEQVALASNAPFRGSVRIEGGWRRPGGPSADAEVMWGSAELAQVLRLEIVAGRWFEPADRALDWEPVVVDRRLARELFGGEDPLGRPLEPAEPGGPEPRVIGVVDAFRRAGELHEGEAFGFRFSRSGGGDDEPIDTLLIRVGPGTRADFEEPLVERLQAVARGWTFTVRPLAAEREASLMQWLVPLAVATLVGGFLLSMVVLGLTGVMWQNVTRRTREIGLRRATGARRGQIHGQIVAEVMLTAGFGVAGGTLVALQTPMLAPLGFVPLRVVLVAVVAAAAFMLALAALCGLYPGWMAARVQPAEALHHA